MNTQFSKLDIIKKHFEYTSIFTNTLLIICLFIKLYASFTNEIFMREKTPNALKSFIVYVDFFAEPKRMLLN